MPISARQKRGSHGERDTHRTESVSWRELLAVTLVLAALAWQSALAADSYPAKPIRQVVPFPASSSPDVVARYLGSKLAERMGQPFVVDNRAGAAGMLGAEAVAKGIADGGAVPTALAVGATRERASALL